MVVDTQDDMQPSSPGKENRAFTRNAIFLVAECLIPQQPVRAIVILDFCPSGVFLTFPPGEQASPAPVPLRGQIIEIRCTVPTANGVQSLRFQGRVARADRAGAGIAFINPSFEALQALHEFARNPPPGQARSAGQKPEGAGTTGEIDVTAESLINACIQTIEERLEPMAKAFLEQVAERFFNLAGEVRTIAEKNAYYTALSTFNKDGAAFTSEFLTRMQNRLRQRPLVASVTRKDSRASGEAGELSLSLIEEDVFEDWLSFTDMARASELEHKVQLHALERRLSDLFKRPVDKENNPFGPGTISQVFQEALGVLALDRKVAADSCKVFKNVLCDQAGELYAELNRRLIDSGVLPVLRPPGKQFQPDHSVRGGAAEQRLQPEAALLPQPEPVPAASVTGLAVPPVQSAEGFPSFGNPLPSVSQPAPPVPPVVPVNAMTSGVTVPPGVESPTTVPVSMPQPPQDWYQVMQALNSLQQNLSVAAAHSGGQGQAPYPAVPATGGTFTPAPPFSQADAPTQQPMEEQRHFTTDEVLSALSRIRLGTPGKQPGENFRQDLMHKLQSALTDGAPSAETRELPIRETNILEIGGNLFDSVLTDKLVANTVKPWLNQLSIPLIKMALRDDSLFYDKSHLARQLINQIAELELFGAVSKVENSVRKKIDGLLAEISGADEVTPDLLQKMLKEVSLLVHVQNKAYEGNIRDLRAFCEVEEHRTKSEKPADNTSALSQLVAELRPLTGEEAPAEEDEALSEYRKRVRRLKIGNWLLLERDDLQKRIRLAWVSQNLDKYVFVNVQGLREETLSQNELAQYMRNGEVVVLDEGEEQLVDRAQSAMLQKMHHQLLHETSHDQLTGLINRRAFERRLAETLARVRDSGTPSMLCYLDLEQFSVVNNTFGYEGGDRALVEASRMLKQELGERGVLARIGGVEFAMLFENCSLDDALQITSRQTGAFRDYRFTSGDKSLSLSFSAGLVSIDPESESIEMLLQAAETSCRIARSKGTNYVQVYRADEASLARHINTVKWVSRIDEALDNGRLELRCQPIVCISGRSVAVHHSEVLLGVPDEQGKLMSPVDFIMAAEHFRRMASVDRWVVEHAFRWMVDRRDRLAELGGFAINLSGVSLNEEGFIEFVIDQAEKLKVPMNKVCFEITETVGISHLSAASEFINELKKRTGCAFSLDDFGSGQSSYAYLKNLPVDYLKIDGAFVEKMDQNPYDFAVVKSITEIGHFMGKKIIAERVENEAVLKMLRQIGVDYAQGYYLGKLRNMKTLGSY
jgi:diguanylate cyclase (GGDEF)-like protein